MISLYGKYNCYFMHELNSKYNTDIQVDRHTSTRIFIHKLFRKKLNISAE